MRGFACLALVMLALQAPLFPAEVAQSQPTLSATRQVLDYDSGLAVVRQSIREGSFPQAEVQLRSLLSRYPRNPELMLLLAKVLFWQNKYEEAKTTYTELLLFQDDESLRQELAKVELAEILHKADLCIKKGRTKDAEALLLGLFSSGKERYESGYRLGILYIKEREYGKALETFYALRLLFPNDLGFAALYLETLLLSGDIAAAKRELKAFPPETQAHLETKREDLFYRIKRNFLKIGVASFQYGRDRPAERELRLDLAQRVGRVPLVLSLARVRRFGLFDRQLGLEIYSPFGEKTKNWGYLWLAVSPDAVFLPKVAFGGEISMGLRGADLSLGFRRLMFSNHAVDLVIPGATIYFPKGFSLNEKVYLVPQHGSASLLSTVHYEPNHKIRMFLSMLTGNVSERLASREDVKEIRTFATRMGLEYRLHPVASLGIEAFREERKNLYRQRGVVFFTRAWW